VSASWRAIQSRRISDSCAFRMAPMPVFVATLAP
jgi:hypothetical protein